MVKRTIILFITLLLVKTTIAQNNNDSLAKKFELTYMFIGFGSNMGSMAPVLRIDGNQYVYTMEQNSSWNGEFKEPEFVCKGDIRESSIDSIINIYKTMEDSSVYKFSSAMSGGVISLSVKKDGINKCFTLHNAYDPTAEKIVGIINTNLPKGVRQLWISDIPPYGLD